LKEKTMTGWTATGPPVACPRPATGPERAARTKAFLKKKTVLKIIPAMTAE
jgi:hypothetical protein